ncbi:MAG: hypothetical protein K1X78_10205 [Verrucomicrobiaceae bacterium]|nr:hypothetical protein [Verrucomicrobiaceae bacterium]
MRADTTLNLTVKDSTGALVKTGTVLIERDGAPPQSLKLGDNQPLAKPIAGNGRFHLTIVADDPGLNAWSVRNLSAQATSQSFTAELRRPEVEPQWLKQHAAALRAHFDEVMKRSRPARGASPSR